MTPAAPPAPRLIDGPDAAPASVLLAHGAGAPRTARSPSASHAPYLQQAETMARPVLSITDAKALCSNARFCDPHGGIWALVKQSNEPGPRQLVAFQASHCPSGRLIAWERATGQSIESNDQASIGLIVDTKKGVNGPIWVRGGLPIHSEMRFVSNAPSAAAADPPISCSATVPTHSP